jgi:hypothetical protein
MTSISTSPPRSQRRVREWSSSSHGAPPSAGFGHEALAQEGRRMVRVVRREIAEIEAGWSRNSDVAGLPPELRDGLEAAIERAESHRKVV